MSREEGKRGKRRPGIDGMGGGDIPCGLLYLPEGESAVLGGRRAFRGSERGVWMGWPAVDDLFLIIFWATVVLFLVGP